MNLFFAREKIRTAIWQSTATSYGLTLVIGLPFPYTICSRIQHIQDQLDTLAPGGFTWYDRDHIHATLVALLRGRYREAPPLRREELPSDLEDFTSDLGNLSTKLQPFPLELANVEITDEGFVMIAASGPIPNLSFTFQKYPKLDRPKQNHGLHVTIGYLKTQELFASDEERERFREGFSQIMHTHVGQIMVQQVWLVHYANRTLNRIIGKIAFDLGRPNSLTAERLLGSLGIIDQVPPFM